ncbi:peptidoglycan hydrolase RipC [Mycobacterium sp. CVI_P3]|uniref:Peptidoglycan hydrolase RipC n=1 Tax=Mycobacterium pinniadriaticum TaxID=2994102 RepID=A0ABT3SJM7_9MYCO|nr:peptidoglycan hydrolase RipC [Mycobacterium pinniadriaticum]MCX2933316.1 peptidoglycan hydrolase RipC [Mycobacterium pinniadriaticum]MCX2939738.1 peptidoglycan hydrolase RipC [Mycobacterium pinniadriaticum]
MSFDRTFLTKRVFRRTLVGGIAALTVFSGVISGSAHADPAEDGLAKLNELSRQAEQLTESMHTAQLDLDKKLQAEGVAEKKHSDDLAAADAAKAQLTTYQSAVDKFAAAVYMGGRTDGLNAILTAESPQGLIDKMAVQRVMAAEMAAQMQNYRRVNDELRQTEAASAKSAADAKTAAEQAAAVRADLQRKQSQLQVQIAAVKSRYQTLTPEQRTALAAPGPPPPADILAAPAPAGLPPLADVPPPDALPLPPSPDAPPPPPEAAEVVPMAAVPAPGPGGEQAAVAVQAALTRIGDPYVWGGSGPNAFDCSGLVMWSFQQAGIFLPHSSQALAHGGQPVSLDQMQPGDVVNYYSDASHSAIYIGDGMMVHASTFGQPVRIAPVNNAPIYNVRRY